MSYILHIETSSSFCSVALSHHSIFLSELISEKENDHAGQLTILIEKLLINCSVTAKQIQAISISAGPGSYTGLRIGASVAKGICHAFHIPLISVSTLQVMAMPAIEMYGNSDVLYCPMIDARRLEIYCCILNSLNNFILQESAFIINESFFQKYLDKNKILFFGTGAEKCKPFLIHNNSVFLNAYKFSAKHMISLSYHKFIGGDFSDIAYFEPNYLKPFYSIFKV